MLGSATSKIVEVRIRSQSSVEERPRHPINCFLLRSHRAYDYLSVQSIVKILSKIRLDWQRLSQELHEKLLAWSITHEQALRRKTCPI